MRYQPLYLNQIGLVLLQYSPSHCVLVLRQELAPECILVDITHIIDVDIFDPLLLLLSHIPQLILELLGAVCLNELPVHLQYFVENLGVIINLRQGILQFVELPVDLLVLQHFVRNLSHIALSLNLNYQILQPGDTALDVAPQPLEHLLLLLESCGTFELNNRGFALELPFDGEHS